MKLTPYDWNTLCSIWFTAVHQHIFYPLSMVTISMGGGKEGCHQGWKLLRSATNAMAG